MRKIRIQPPLYWLAIWAGGTLLFIIIALCSILGLLHKVSQRQLILFSQGIVESSAQASDDMSTAVKDILDGISLDPDLSKLINYESIPSNDLLRGLQQLKMYRETNYLVDSIYIYNNRNQNVYVASPNAMEAVYALSDFYDQSAVEVLNRYQNYQNMSPFFRNLISTYPTMEVVPMVSYLRYNTLAPQGDSYVIMINIREDVLYEQLNTVSADMDTLLLLADQQGSVKQISSPEGDLEIPEGLAQKVLKQEETDGYFVDESLSAERIVCYRSVLNNKWVLISVSDENSLNILFRSNEYIGSLLMLILLFAFCCVGAIVVIRKLSEVISANRQKLIQIEHERREKAYENKRQAILGFLKTPGREMETVLPLIKNGYPICTDKDAVLVILYLDQYTTSIPEQYATMRDRKSLKYGICNIAEELLAEFEVSFSSYEDDARCFVMLQSVRNETALLDKLCTVQNSVLAGLGISLSVFVSPRVPLGEVAHSYETLSNALPYRQLVGLGKILTSEMLEARESTDVEIKSEKLKQLSQLILQMDIEKVQRHLKEMLFHIARGSYKSFQVNLVQIVVCIDDALTKLQLNNGIEKAIHVGTMLHSINSLESVAEIYSSIETVLLQTEKRIEQSSQGNQHNKLILQIQEMVRRGYSNQDFSINMVAERLNMSAAYLSRLFKKNTGVTFVEYVLSVRMNEACYLLAETETPIEEVVAQVGFSDISYFYKTFKKVNGCTPAVYRKNRQN